MTDETKALLWFTSIMLVVLMCATVYLGVAILRYQGERFNDDCDSMYGPGNWVANETTGTGECSFYPGQCWRCVRYVNASELT